jgi:KDO2-lipid IV(A) lauroyltransferase
MTSRARRLLDLGSLVVRPFPVSVVRRAGEGLGVAAARLLPDQLAALQSNVALVRPELDDRALRRLAIEGFGSYGRYWAETFRLPGLSAAAIDRGFDVDGFEHLRRARAAGHGPIMALPHLGGWEWAAAWLGRVAEINVTAVVEPLEPPDVFEWFRDVRTSYGINVVPLGPDALGSVVSAVRALDVVCLLADRDLADGGVEVDFFGATTTLPVGPALVARRTGAPLLPTAVYFDGNRRLCRILPPVEIAVGGGLRADLRTTTQRLARDLELLIDAAPEQWHVLQPIAVERSQ